MRSELTGAGGPSEPRRYFRSCFGADGPWGTHTWRDHTWRNHTWRNHTWRNHIWRNHTWRNHTWRNHTWRNHTSKRTGQGIGKGRINPFAQHFEQPIQVSRQRLGGVAQMLHRD